MRKSLIMSLRNLRTLALILLTLLGVAAALVLPAQSHADKARLESVNVGPVLQTQSNSTRGVALESVSLKSEPFTLVTPVRFGVDNRTRITLFATNLTLLPGETASAIIADAQDAALAHYALTVESVGPVPEQPWLTQVVMRL